MRKRYTHTNPTEPLRIRNQFSHRDLINVAATSSQGSLRPILQLPEENDDIDDMDFQYNDDDNMDMVQYHEDEDDDGNYNDVEDEEEDNENEDDVEDGEEDSEDEEEDSENEEEDSENEEEDSEYNDVEDKDSDDDIEIDSEDSEDDREEHHQIIDKALDKDNMPTYDGEFAPYFQNFTTAALFCWIQKHNISTNAYEDLVDIITKSEFNGNHVVKNIRRFRTWRQRLPLLSILENSISISSKKSPSTSKNSKMAYQLSINDIIFHILNNSTLFKHMYFGPGINSEIKSEYWHGTLWGESPLFGEDQIIISGKEYKCGDFVYYDIDNKLGRLRSILKNDDDQYQLRIQKIINYDDLPRNFKGTLTSLESEVWLKDEFQIITTSQISKKASVMIEFQHQHIPENALRINEIIYKNNDH
jgi:hypothetical protein